MSDECVCVAGVYTSMYTHGSTREACFDNYETVLMGKASMVCTHLKCVRDLTGSLRQVLRTFRLKSRPITPKNCPSNKSRRYHC